MLSSLLSVEITGVSIVAVKLYPYVKNKYCVCGMVMNVSVEDRVIVISRTRHVMNSVKNMGTTPLIGHVPIAFMGIALSYLNATGNLHPSFVWE